MQLQRTKIISRHSGTCRRIKSIREYASTSTGRSRFSESIERRKPQKKTIHGGAVKSGSFGFLIELKEVPRLTPKLLMKLVRGLLRLDTK